MRLNCPFCELPPERTIIESALALLILSNPRLIPGHTLVIPKRHIEDPRELEEREILEIFEHIKEVETKLIKAGLATGCDIRQHFRPFVKQNAIKVDHVHFHVLPRKKDDVIYETSLKHEKALFSVLETEEFQKVSKILKK